METRRAQKTLKRKERQREKKNKESSLLMAPTRRPTILRRTIIISGSLNTGIVRSSVIWKKIID